VQQLSTKEKIFTKRVLSCTAKLQRTSVRDALTSSLYEGYSTNRKKLMFALSTDSQDYSTTGPYVIAVIALLLMFIRTVSK
jgi:hypothetical protein